MTFVSYAQNFEDVLLWRALGRVGRGFYIDAGAAHPDIDSVTRAFHERGWRGINVEPVGEYVERLRASRPEDVTVHAALSDQAGTAELFVVPGTGLSTLDRAGLPRLAAHGFDFETRQVSTQTLAAVCRRYAPGDIHFLKVDVEGSEAAVLAGADFAAFRPWIVLVEATEAMSTTPSHQAWEPALLTAGYRFVWFDGLNRFYVAAERHAELAPHFATPPNVFDDFVRAADSEWTRRIAQAETQAQMAESRAVRSAAAEARLGVLLQATELRAAEEAARAGELAGAGAQLRHGLEALQVEAGGLRAALGQAAGRLADLTGRTLDAIGQAGARVEDAERRARSAADWLLAMRHSNSWRVTAPARRLTTLLRGRPGPQPDHAPRVPPADPASLPPSGGSGPEAGQGGPVPVAVLPSTAGSALPGSAIAAVSGCNPSSADVRLRRAVHQFHSGSAISDAITNAMLLTRRVLRERGYGSEIFVEHRAVELAHELRLLDELPTHDDYVLIVRHSTGHDALARVLALPAPKVLMYHNITPAELLGRDPFIQRYAALGRAQLALLRDHVAAALADSEYNVLELRRAGFAAPRACCLLFDLDALGSDATGPEVRRSGSGRPGARERGRGKDAPFTILFVGRIIESKAQAELVDAFARLRAMLNRPARLVLVGRAGNAAQSYRGELDGRIRAHRLGADEVVLTGLVSDDELRGWYDAADLYVSLSHHEGFGVPLVEAVARGVAVLAWPSGAVPYTLGEPSGLLQSRLPSAVAERIRALAEDPAARHALAARQRAQLARFRLDAQLPVLFQALVAAGTAPPEHKATAAALGAAMRFTVMGHVGGHYSLAAVNRALALALEAELPGRVRLVAVETVPTDDLSRVPAEAAEAIGPLTRRPPHPSGPHIVISQHFPVYLPEDAGDAALALFFWEESLVPADTIARLNAGFRAVLAPSVFVAKVLVDSGLAIPVHVIGHAPTLDGLAALAEARDQRPDVRGDSLGVFTFLHVSSCFPRKGVDLLLAAYALAFRRGDRVRLIIKGFPNPHNDAAAQLARLRTADLGVPDIELIDRDLGRDEMLALYARADAMVLPSRGEGFNLPAAEAMAAGLKLIVTGFGGHLDFCDADTARLVDWQFAASTSHLATAHSVWAEPDLDDLVGALRAVVEAPGPGTHAGTQAGGRARRARARVAARLDRGAYVRRLTAAATAALLAPPAVLPRIAWISTWNVRCGVSEYSRHLLASLPETTRAGVLVLADDRTPEHTRGSGPCVRPAWVMGHPDGVRSLVATVVREDAAVVVVQHQPGLFHWYRLAELLTGLEGRIVVVTLHNTRDVLDVAEDERRAALSRLAGVARVLVHTLADLNRLKDLGLVANVTLLPHGAPAPFLLAEVAPPSPARELDEGTPAPLVGCYGFFLPDKGIRQLIEALALLRQRWPGARLRLVNAEYDGPDGAAEIARCREAAIEAGVADAVEWHTTFLPDARSLALLAECDVVALPYQRSGESSSAALRVAMAAGPPVVTTRLALFDEAGDAVLRCGGTDAELAAGLGRLFDDQARRAELQRAARAWIEARQWDAVGRRLDGMLRGLVAMPPAPPPPVTVAREHVARDHAILVAP